MTLECKLFTKRDGKYIGPSGRQYNEEVLKQALSKYMEENNNMHYGHFGEERLLDHISHNVTDISINEHKITATIETLNTPYGQILEKMIESNSIDPLFGISAIGTVNKDGVVNSITHIQSIDFIN